MSAKDEIIQHGATNCRHLPEVHMLERLHDLEDALLSFQTNYKNNCCWPSGEGVRRHTIKNIETGSQIKGKQQTQLFNNGENIIYPPSSTQAVFQFFNIVLLLLIG